MRIYYRNITGMSKYNPAYSGSGESTKNPMKPDDKYYTQIVNTNVRYFNVMYIHVLIQINKCCMANKILIMKHNNFLFITGHTLRYCVHLLFIWKFYVFAISYLIYMYVQKAINL